MASKIIRLIRGNAGVSNPVANKNVSGIDTRETMAASLFSLEGHEAESDQGANRLFLPQPGQIEIDAAAAWDAVCAAVRSRFEGSSAEWRQIRSVSATRHGNSLCKDHERARSTGVPSRDITEAVVPGVADLSAKDFARVTAVPPLGRIAA